MNAASLINQSSGLVEFYTPANIIEAARATMGGVISLDPASSASANERVGALRWFGVEADGLSQPWRCNSLWMNHPFGRGKNEAWIGKLMAEYAKGNVSQVCCITFASTSEKWFRPLLEYPQCFLSPRTNYLLPDGTVYRGVTKGSVVTYLGPNVDGFRKAFKGLGVVKV
jgi:hypothetical protein